MLVYSGKFKFSISGVSFSSFDSNRDDTVPKLLSALHDTTLVELQSLDFLSATTDTSTATKVDAGLVVQVLAVVNPDSGSAGLTTLTKDFSESNNVTQKLKQQWGSLTPPLLPTDVRIKEVTLTSGSLIFLCIDSPICDALNDHLSPGNDLCTTQYEYGASCMLTNTCCPVSCGQCAVFSVSTSPSPSPASGDVVKIVEDTNSNTAPVAAMAAIIPIIAVGAICFACYTKKKSKKQPNEIENTFRRIGEITNDDLKQFDESAVADYEKHIEHGMSLLQTSRNRIETERSMRESARGGSFENNARNTALSNSVSLEDSRDIPQWQRENARTLKLTSFAAEPEQKKNQSLVDIHKTFEWTRENARTMPELSMGASGDEDEASESKPETTLGRNNTAHVEESDTITGPGRQSNNKIIIDPSTVRTKTPPKVTKSTSASDPPVAPVARQRSSLEEERAPVVRESSSPPPEEPPPSEDPRDEEFRRRMRAFVDATEAGEYESESDEDDINVQKERPVQAADSVPSQSSRKIEPETSRISVSRGYSHYPTNSSQTQVDAYPSRVSLIEDSQRRLDSSDEEAGPILSARTDTKPTIWIDRVKDEVLTTRLGDDDTPMPSRSLSQVKSDKSNE